MGGLDDRERGGRETGTGAKVARELWLIIRCKGPSMSPGGGITQMHQEMEMGTQNEASYMPPYILLCNTYILPTSYSRVQTIQYLQVYPYSLRCLVVSACASALPGYTDRSWTSSQDRVYIGGGEGRPKGW